MFDFKKWIMYTLWLIRQDGTSVKMGHPSGWDKKYTSLYYSGQSSLIVSHVYTTS